MAKKCKRRSCFNKAEFGNVYCTKHNVEVKMKAMQILARNQQKKEDE